VNVYSVLSNLAFAEKETSKTQSACTWTEFAAHHYRVLYLCRESDVRAFNYSFLLNGRPQAPSTRTANRHSKSQTFPHWHQTPTNARVPIMADPPLHNDSDTESNHAVAPSDAGVLPCPASVPATSRVDEGPGSRSVNRVQNEGSDVHAPLSLPVRQAYRQPVNQPRIHDITDKFTKACEGKLDLSLTPLGFRYSEWHACDLAGRGHPRLLSQQRSVCSTDSSGLC
jgi:hypothetical protein